MDSLHLCTERRRNQGALTPREGGIVAAPALIGLSFVLTWIYWEFPPVRRAFGGPILPIFVVFVMTVAALWLATGLLPRKNSISLRIAVTAGAYVPLWIVAEFLDPTRSLLGFFGPPFLLFTGLVCALFGACPV